MQVTVHSILLALVCIQRSGFVFAFLGIKEIVYFTRTAGRENAKAEVCEPLSYKQEKLDNNDVKEELSCNNGYFMKLNTAAKGFVFKDPIEGCICNIDNRKCSFWGSEYEILDSNQLIIFTDPKKYGRELNCSSMPYSSSDRNVFQKILKEQGLDHLYVVSIEEKYNDSLPKYYVSYTKPKKSPDVSLN